MASPSQSPSENRSEAQALAVSVNDVLKFGCVHIQNRVRGQQLTKQERRNFQNSVRVSTNDFGKTLACIIELDKALTGLERAILRAPDKQLIFYDITDANGNRVMARDPSGNPTDRSIMIRLLLSHVRAGRKQRLHKSIKALKEYHRQANTHPREPKPEEFSGVYIPVYIEEPLFQFFQSAELGPATVTELAGLTNRRFVRAPQSTSLRDSLNLRQTRYAQKNTITTLFYIYINEMVNNLKESLVDNPPPQLWPGTDILVLPLKLKKINAFRPDDLMQRTLGRIRSVYTYANPRPKRACDGSEVDGLNEYEKVPNPLDNQESTFTIMQSRFRLLPAVPDCVPKTRVIKQVPAVRADSVDPVNDPEGKNVIVLTDENGNPLTVPATKMSGWDPTKIAAYYIQNISSLNYTGRKEAKNRFPPADNAPNTNGVYTLGDGFNVDVQGNRLDSTNRPLAAVLSAINVNPSGDDYVEGLKAAILADTALVGQLSQAYRELKNAKKRR